MAERAQLTAAHFSFPGGMDSWSDVLPPDTYVYAMNVLTRGGKPRTRPGSKTLFCLPQGNLQGGALFVPRTGVPHLMAAVEGRIYISPLPFGGWTRLGGIQFNPVSPEVTFTPTLQSTDYDSSGVIVALDQPVPIMIMQDGATRAAYWDGGIAAHLDPTPTAKNSLTVPGKDGTVIGRYSVWSNNRLWVTRGRKVFASDLGNPLKFKDSLYLNELPAFYLPDVATGIIETADNSGILVFYANGADFIETSIQDRTQWVQTPNFQRQALEVGCVAARSLITLHNMIYWFSPKGWLNLNAALAQYSSTELLPLDARMSASKCAIGPDLSRICAGTFENMALVSVPFASLRNTHTWVLDVAVSNGPDKHWSSVWTGWEPVQWASGVVDGRERVFAFCADNDGSNRVWEMMQPDHRDNGCDITCSVQLRMDDFNRPADLKQFSHGVVQLSGLRDAVSCMVAIAGERGWFERLATKEIEATWSRVLPDTIYGDGAGENPRFASSREQSRVFKTSTMKTPTAGACNECGVESRVTSNIDFRFCAVVAWSGVATLQRVRLFAQEWPDDDIVGGCEIDDTYPRVKDASGCSTLALFTDTDGPFPRYEGAGYAAGVGIANVASAITVHSCAFSQISQSDADRRAACRAQFLVNWLAFSSSIVGGSIGFGCNTISITLEGELAVYDEAGLVLIEIADLGGVLWGTEGTLRLRLVNIGGAVLAITGVVFTSDEIVLIEEPAQTTLEPGEYTFITLALAVANEIEFEDIPQT